VPAGYGVQEQCLPFTAATALGLVIPAPITFGHCPQADVPPGCRPFSGPLSLPSPQHDWVFYVQDDERCRFAGNAYHIDREGAPPAVEAGLSFFERDDQHDLFKLHLPYVWRTAPQIDTLFCAPVNRPPRPFEVVAGLVETDWYASPVNLVLRTTGRPIHVAAGDAIAQAVLVSREQRHPDVIVSASHARVTRETLAGVGDWQRQHREDRSAYKVLARSHHGRID
jgi:hypothetical protein